MILRFWFEARALAVLQTYLDQPLRKPLPDFERKLLRGAVNLTRKDGGTPFDAAFRFYAAYAEAAVGRKMDLNEIKFGTAVGRLSTLRHRTKFYSEHISAFKQVRALQDSFDVT